MAEVLGFDPYAKAKRLHTSMGRHPSMQHPSMQPPLEDAELAPVLEFRPKAGDLAEPAAAAR